MLAVFRLFFDIALLKKGPQDVPYSLFLFSLIFLLSFVMDILPSFIPDTKGDVTNIAPQLRYLVVAYIVMIVTLFFVFKLYNKSQRFLQSITATTGSEFIIKIIQLPAIILISGSYAEEPTLLLAFTELFILLTIGWSLMVNLHIFRNGLSISRFNAGLLSLSYFALSLFLYRMLVPGKT